VSSGRTSNERPLQRGRRRAAPGRLAAAGLRPRRGRSRAAPRRPRRGSTPPAGAPPAPPSASWSPSSPSCSGPTRGKGGTRESSLRSQVLAAAGPGTVTLA